MVNMRMQPQKNSQCPWQGSPPSRLSESGMTLLEIIISIALLLVMTIATSSLLRNGIDLRMDLSQRSKVNHRLAIVMQRINEDLQQAFVLNFKRQEYFTYATSRATKSIFTIKMWDNSSELRLTANTHKAIIANSPESDMSFIVYKVEKDRDNQRPSLYRGETKVIPMSFEDDVPMIVLAHNIKAIRILPWNGEAWKDEWNTNKSDWRDTLPRMVKIEVDAYVNDPIDETSPFLETDPISTLRTVVTIPRAIEMKEPKEGSKSIKWDYY